MTWREVSLDVLWERGAYCESCGSPEIENPHHAILFRVKKFAKFLNVKFNLILLCRTCHAEAHAKVREWRRKAWQMNCSRYGHDVMVKWLENLPLKIKPTLSEMERRYK